MSDDQSRFRDELAQVLRNMTVGLVGYEARTPMTAVGLMSITSTREILNHLLPVIEAHVEHAKAEAVQRVMALADDLEDVAKNYRDVPAGTHDAGARNAHMAIAHRIRAAEDGAA